MTELLIFWALVIAVAIALATLRDVLHDGHDHPVPPSATQSSDPLSFLTR
jgi:hypothetical protein